MAPPKYEPGKAFHTQRMRDRKWERDRKKERAKRERGARRGRRTPTCGWTDALTILLPIALPLAVAAWVCA